MSLIENDRGIKLKIQTSAKFDTPAKCVYISVTKIAFSIVHQSFNYVNWSRVAVRDRVVSRQITCHSSVSKARHIQMPPDGGDPGSTWRSQEEPNISPIIDLVIAYAC